jgi:hypothetical protein
MMCIQTKKLSINKPGGRAKITKVHYHDGGTAVRSYDVKYIVGTGGEKELDPALVFPLETLEREGRSRRGRDFLTVDCPAKKTHHRAASGKENEEDPIGNRVVGASSARVEAKKKKRTMNANINSKPKGKENKKQRSTKKEPSPIPSQEGASPATTAPSTPKSMQLKPPVKKVTPIPSYIIADQDVDVSPLERLEDANVAAASSACRRGLFDSYGEANPEVLRSSKGHFANAKTTKICTASPSDKVTRLNHKSNSKATEQSSSKPIFVLANTQVDGKAATVAPTMSVPEKESLPKKSATTTTKNTAASNHKHSRSAPAIGAVPLASSRTAFRSDEPALSHGRPGTKSILSFPRPKSATTGTRIPLQAVFADEMDRATKFVKEVVGARDTDIVGDTTLQVLTPAADDKEKALYVFGFSGCSLLACTFWLLISFYPWRTSQSTIFIPPNRRFEQFLSVFRGLRMKIDDDGAIEEKKFLAMVNEFSPKEIRPFSEDEVECHIKTLSDQGKIMKSDGIIYMVEWTFSSKEWIVSK